MINLGFYIMFNIFAQNEPLPEISKKDLISIIEDGPGLSKVEMVYPTPDLIDKSWDLIVKKEFGHTNPTPGSAQWLEWVYRGLDIRLISNYEHFSDAIKKSDNNKMWGYMQDALAIAPLNVTPQFLADQIARKKFLFFLCEQSLRSTTSTEVESLLRSVVVVSGMPRHKGDLSLRWKHLWNTRNTKWISELLPVVFEVTVNKGETFLIRVR